LYPADDAKNAGEDDGQSERDRMRTGLYFWASKRAASHRSPVYIYYFDRAIPWPEHPEYGVFHSGELPYVFGNMSALDRPWRTEDSKLSKTVISYLKNFVSTGDPNSRSVPHWSPANLATPSVMRLDTICGAMEPADGAKFEFWEKYYTSPQSRYAPVF
jgi:para-nitrobenzyl esterase